MATVEQIIQEIREELTDDGFPTDRILVLLNRGAVEIAAGDFPYPNVGQIFLPALATREDFAVTSGEKSTALSGLTNTFQKHIIDAYNKSADTPIKVRANLTELEIDYPGLIETGTVFAVAETGGNLYCQGTSGDTLTLHFYKEPDTLEKGDTPSFLPSHLQTSLLKNYVLMNIPGKYRSGMLTNPEDLFSKAIYQLWKWVGPPPKRNTKIKDVYYHYYW